MSAASRASSPASVALDTDDRDDVVVGKKTTQRRFRLLDMMGLFAMSFCYGFIFSSVVTLVVPQEIQRMTQYKQSAWMSLVMGCGAISQLCSPIVGAWSDRLARRVSFIVYGTILCIFGVICFFIVRLSTSLLLLCTAHFITMVGLSVIYSMISALLNDCIHPEQVGTGSGTIAILGTLGSGSSYLMFAMDLPLEYTYTCYILTSVLCLGISVLFIPSNLDSLLAQSQQQLKRENKKGFPTAGALFLEAITLPSPSQYPDFFLACTSRMLFNTALAAQVYMAYFFRDVMMYKAPTQVVSLVAVMSLIGCTIAALPAGILSDRVGKKPVIYVGVAICVLALMLFLINTSKETFLLIGLLYGVGNIAYLSVDYAVGVASLPRLADSDPPTPIDAAKDLGIFSMSATLGSVVGQVLYGGILDIYSFDQDGVTRYTNIGFTAAFGTAGLFFILSGLSVRWIQCID